MRIGINGRFLVAKRTGVQRAAYNLLKTLLKLDKENTYIIFTGRDKALLEEWNYPNVVLVPSKIRSGESFRNHIWEQFWLPILAWRFKVDLLHSPANMAPFLFWGKSIVHIHDLCFVVNPHWYSFSFHTLYNFLIPRLARRATRVITNSNNSKNDLLQYCGIAPSHVSLIYWAVDEMFSQTEDPRQLSEDLEKVRQDYILYVGSLEPRKNISTLVRAFEHFRKSNPDTKTKLILIGGESPLFAQVRLKIQDFKDDVLLKGFVDDQQLRLYYRHASLVVYPSLYEGFGLPPLEAMASGAPVITSNTSSLPEVVGKAAIQVNPYDVNDLANKVAKVLKDRELRIEMSYQGLLQSQKFSWQRVAFQTLSVYQDVYSEGTQGVNDRERLLRWRQLRADCN